MLLSKKILFLTTKPNLSKINPYSSIRHFSFQTQSNDKTSDTSVKRVLAHQKAMAKKKEELGIIVKPVTKETSREALDFIWKYFILSEPVSRSLQLKQGWWIDQIRYRPLVQSGVCLAAYDKHNGQLVSVLAGRVLDRNDRLTRLRDQLGKYGYIYILPLVGSAVKPQRFFQARSLIGYDPWAFMEERNIGKIYEGGLLTVHKDYRGKGIGELLMHDLFPVLQARGCQATYEVYSSKYSVAIIEKMGDFELLGLKKFSELIDDKGELLFPDAGVENALSVRTRKI